jgi:signal transduction histidine kinase
MRIVDHNREEIAARQRTLVLAAGAAALLAFGAALLVGARRDARRLTRVGDALEELASGALDIRVADRGRDHIGAVARMIERASEAVGRDRQRLASLRHLEAWQEGARRQAHELRTPLTVVRLELDRLEEAGVAVGPSPALERSLAEVRAEVRRLEERVQRFATFARLPVPCREVQDLRELLGDFACTFADAWPGLGLATRLPEAACPAAVDRGMIREVLVNLCENSHRALAGAPGTVTFDVHRAEGSNWVHVDVADDGPGVARDVRGRVFEPYVTTAAPGQGMGLGLSICRKILLDHGGDLELLESAPGATFRLLLPAEGPCRG